MGVDGRAVGTAHPSMAIAICIIVHYASLFAQKEQHRKKTIKKQQQTTNQTGINAALTVISYHMTC